MKVNGFSTTVFTSTVKNCLSLAPVVASIFLSYVYLLGSLIFKKKNDLRPET